MKAASRSCYSRDTIGFIQNSSISREWTKEEDESVPLLFDDTLARRNDIGLKLIESFFVVTEGRRLRFYRLSARNLKKGAAQKDSYSEIRDGWQALFEYHRLNVRNETVCLSTGGSMYLGNDEMIGFDMHLELSREYCRKKRLSLRLGSASVTLVPMGRQEDCFCENENRSGVAVSNDERDYKTAYISSFNKAFNGDGPAEILVYDLDNDGWIAPKDALFDMLSPTLAVSEQNAMLFRFGTAGFGEIRFYDAPLCAG